MVVVLVVMMVVIVVMIVMVLIVMSSGDGGHPKIYLLMFSLLLGISGQPKHTRKGQYDRRCGHVIGVAAVASQLREQEDQVAPLVSVVE